MRDIVFPDIVVYILIVLFVAAVMLTIFSGLIADWLMAREERKKKAAAEAEAATKPD